MKAVAQVGDNTFLVADGEGQTDKARIVDLAHKYVGNTLKLGSLLRAGYWGRVTDKAAAVRAVELAQEKAGG